MLGVISYSEQRCIRNQQTSERIEILLSWWPASSIEMREIGILGREFYSISAIVLCLNHIALWVVEGWWLSTKFIILYAILMCFEVDYLFISELYFIQNGKRSKKGKRESCFDKIFIDFSMRCVTLTRHDFGSSTTKFYRLAFHCHAGRWRWKVNPNLKARARRRETREIDEFQAKMLRWRALNHRFHFMPSTESSDVRKFVYLFACVRRMLLYLVPY